MELVLAVRWSFSLAVSGSGFLQVLPMLEAAV
ncbi:hypothetical protein Goshw_013256, partial [Gossypium schwendimanii]|nr:hypothetical protein [Gossypium schwendimanii]